MFCTRCGAENPNTGQFCTRCGTTLQAASASLAGVAPPAVSPPTAPAHAYAAAGETSGKAIGSLACGIFFFVFPAAVVAIILGHLALSEIRKSAGRIQGHGIAVAGLVLGYMGVAFIPFILIVAAIAIPNLLRARIAANEASTVGTLRIINTAAFTYSTEYSNGFPPNLETLDGTGIGSASCDYAQLIDSSRASGARAGYVITYTLQTADGSAPTLSPEAVKKGCTIPGGSAYTVIADPVTRGTTGSRSFFTDQTGVIRFSIGGPATADSLPIE